MTFRHVVLATLFLPLAGCGSGGPSLVGSSLPRLSGSVASAAPSTSTSANGSFTWTSIIGSRPLCREITSQVGQSWPLWFSMRSDGSSVVLSFSEGPPTNDPLAEGPAIFAGTRSGNDISASRSGSMGGMACPGDRAITPQVGGSLTATLSENQISGDYTEIFGTGGDQVTFVFHFQATLLSSLWGITYMYPWKPGDAS